MFSVRSLRFRLLVAVNAAVVTLLGVFVAVDYQRELGRQVAQMHVALMEEAKTMLPAVVRIWPQGEQAVQEYIDDVCGRMQDTSSPGHHIVVQSGDAVLQSVAHHRASAAILGAMKKAAEAPAHRANFRGEELVVGDSRQGDTEVYVSEYTGNIQRSARGYALRRLLRIALLVFVTVVVANVVFLRMAVRPLQELVATVRRIADGELGIHVGPFKSAEFDYLAEAINSMSASLAAADRHRSDEMARARGIQEAVLPRESEFPGLEVASLYAPAKEVAGDYYDIVALDGGDWLICVADVMGHGVPAAMSAMMLKTFLLHATERHAEPENILDFINRRMVTICRSENLATMFVARYDPRNMTLDYASAGHEIAMLATKDGTVQKLPATGFLLAVMEDATWESKRFSVGEGDRLYIPTDGITEAFNPGREMFRRERLAQLIVEVRDRPLAKSVEEIGTAVVAHRGGAPPSDDATLLAVEFSSPLPEGG